MLQPWKYSRAPAITTLSCTRRPCPPRSSSKAISDAHFVGIRSRTQLTEDVFAAAKKLVAVGCFCIGTNQVDLKAATSKGVAVFNAPFSNTRSVAELVIAEAILLLRGVAAEKRRRTPGRVAEVGCQLL